MDSVDITGTIDYGNDLRKYITRTKNFLENGRIVLCQFGLS